MRRSRIIRLAFASGVFGLPAAATSPAAAQIFSSSSSGGETVDCSAMDLTAAKGVPHGAVRAYRLHGVCRLIAVKHSSSKVAGITTDTDHSSTQVGTVWATTEIRWERSTGALQQAMEVDGDRTGTLKMVLKCAQDPVLGKVLCQKVAYDNGTGWSGFDAAWHAARPITNGRVTEAEAAALSKQASTSNPPPPPPAPGKPAPTPAPAARTAPAATSTVAAAPTAPTSVSREPTSQPGPPDAPAPTGYAEIPLRPDTRRLLESGRALATRPQREGLRWAILAPDGRVLRLFPEGSRAFENRRGEVVVDWGGGTYQAGRARRGRLRLPGSR